MKRAFQRTGELLVDVYGATETGKEISFRIPEDALRELGSTSSARATVPKLEVDDLVRRRVALRERLRAVDVAALSCADFHEARRLSDPETGKLLAARYSEMEAIWREEHVDDLACASSALLTLDPTHTRAATVLATAFLDKGLSHHRRALVAGHLGDAFQPAKETEAMALLADALRSLLHSPKANGWGPFAYTCVGRLYELDGPRVLRRCKRELSMRDAWRRIQLILELATIPAADVFRLLKSHLRREPSCRVRVALVRILGGLVPERLRIAHLEMGLDDESPSCRFLAMKALRRVRPPVASELARAALEHEPDAYLRALLEQVVRAA